MILHESMSLQRSFILRPDPKVRRQNAILLHATFLHDYPDEDGEEHLEGVSTSLKNRKDAAEFLLSMSTGSFSDDRIVHHCRAGCCRDIRESKLKMWCAVQVTVLKLMHSFGLIV